MDELKVFVNSFIGKVMTGLTITLIVFLCSTIYGSINNINELTIEFRHMSKDVSRDIAEVKKSINKLDENLSNRVTKNSEQVLEHSKKIANLEGQFSIQKNMSCEDIKKNNKSIEMKYINIDFEKELCLK